MTHATLTSFAAAVCVCLIAGLGLPGFAVSDSRPQAAVSKQRVFALLATGELVRVTLGAARTETVGRVANPLKRIAGRGPFLARGQRVLFATLPSTPSRLYRMSARSDRMLRSRSLGSGVVARALLVGPRTHRVYVVAHDSAQDGGTVLLVFSPNGARLVKREVLPLAHPEVFNAAISPTERQLAISHHEGGSVFDLSEGSTRALALHGSVHFAGRRLFAASGSRSVKEFTTSGKTVTYDSRLAGNHFLYFAGPKRRHGYLFVIGECGYTGGLARVFLASARVKLLVPPGQGKVCGSRMIVGADNALVVASNPVPFPDPGTAGAVRLVDERTGRIRSSVKTTAPVVDIAAAP